MSDREPTRLLTLEEVAERLHKTLSMARWMKSRGDFPRSAKIGGRVMVRESDLEEWISQQFGETPEGDRA
jgi:predicted DNA-binding transcriptional regulator AlpA